MINIPEKYLKAVLSYLITIDQKLSIYQLEMIINNRFRLMKAPHLPGEYYRMLLDSSFISLCEPENKQREAFKVTDLGKDHVSLDRQEQQKVLSDLKLCLGNLGLADIEIVTPFLSFNVEERRFKLLVLLDINDSRLQVSLPNDSPEAVEYIEYPLHEILNDPEILRDRIKEQIDILKI